MNLQQTKATIKIVNNWRLYLAAILLASLPSQVFADDRTESYAALHVQDVRLAAIADRMLAANLPLCRRTMPLTGIILHSADQYREPLSQWFTQGNIAASSILPGSPADEAGLQANDGLLGVNGVRFDSLAAVEGEPRRDTVFDWIAQSGETSPMQFTLSRDGFETTADINAQKGCYALVEVLAETDKTARSDGRVIQISYGMASMLSDDQLAAVFAHEMAHAVLEHRRRLVEAGVGGGLFGEFGRNRRLAREVEVEADLLSVHLLANAGFDPAIAPEFWRSEAGAELGRGFFRSRRYPSREARAELMETEIATYLSDQNGISLAQHILDKRDIPFAD